MKNFIYVISGEHGRQKIGTSDNPRQRIKDLQTASPYPLRFEFLGEVENGAAGQVEVEAHFMLNQHKAAGGDEWFVVPPDVAVTAVMAAAHRLGYRCKPVDSNALTSGHFLGTKPLWLAVVMLPFFVLYLYWLLGIAGQRMMADEIPVGTFVIEAVVGLVLLRLLMYLIEIAGRQLQATWDAAATRLR